MKTVSTTLTHFAPALFLFLLLSGCATGPEERDPIPFPPPPAEPRFFYETALISTSQVTPKSEKSWRRTLTGETQTGRNLGKPHDVVACKGRIFVTDTARGFVTVLDFPAGESRILGQERPGLLRKPIGLAKDKDCNLYVADTAQSRVVKFSPEGKYLNAYGIRDQFDRLTHVAVTPAGDRVIGIDTGGVESENHRVRVMDGESGQILFDVGKGRGSEPGYFNFPKDAEVGPDGNLYVVDSGNFRVQVFDLEDGSFLRTWGKVGRMRGQFSRPKGIALDSAGRVYVADAAFGNFQIFTPEGDLLMAIGQRGTKFAPAKYLLPSGLDIDRDGRIYFVGQSFRKVEVFRPAGMKPTDGDLGEAIPPGYLWEK